MFVVAAKYNEIFHCFSTVYFKKTPSKYRDTFNSTVKPPLYAHPFYEVQHPAPPIPQPGPKAQSSYGMQAIPLSYLSKAASDIDIANSVI